MITKKAERHPNISSPLDRVSFLLENDAQMPSEIRSSKCKVILKECSNLSLFTGSVLIVFCKAGFCAKKRRGIASFVSNEFYLFLKSLNNQYLLCGK